MKGSNRRTDSRPVVTCSYHLLRIAQAVEGDNRSKGGFSLLEYCVRNVDKVFDQYHVEVSVDRLSEEEWLPSRKTARIRVSKTLYRKLSETGKMFDQLLFSWLFFGNNLFTYAGNPKSRRITDYMSKGTYRFKAWCISPNLSEDGFPIEGELIIQVDGISGSLPQNFDVRTSESHLRRRFPDTIVAVF